MLFRFFYPTRFVVLLGLILLAAPAAQAQAGDNLKPAKNRNRYMFPQRDTESAAVQNVTKNTDEDADINGTYTRVGYRSYPEMLAEIDELKKLHTWADTTYQRRLAALPPGGGLLVSIRRKGAINTNLANLTIVGTSKTGQELFKITPPATPGRFYGRDLYQAQRLLPFPKMEAQAVTLTIADPKVFQTFEYVVTVP